MIGTLTELKLERTQKKMVKSVDSEKALEEKGRRMDKHSGNSIQTVYSAKL